MVTGVVIVRGFVANNVQKMSLISVTIALVLREKFTARPAACF